MAEMYLDTNVFLRFLTNDHAEHSPRAYQLFKELEQGSRTARTMGIVIAEIVYVLSSPRLYNLPRRSIQSKLEDVISLKGLKLDNKGTYKRALQVYAAHHLDFVDAYLVALAERTSLPIASFDRHIDKVPGVARFEP